MVNKRQMARSLSILIVMVIMIVSIFMPGCSSIDGNDTNIYEEIYSSDPLIIGDEPVDEVFEIDNETEFHHTGGIMVTGEGTLVVNGGKLYQTGDVYVTENGKLIVDGGEFHIDGNDTNVYVDKNGSVSFRNNALLHYVQDYVAQHNLIAGNNGHFEFRDSRVDCDGSIEFVWMVDNASYEAVNTTFSDWTTWFLWNQTSLSLENVNYAGDIVFYDSPTLRFVNTKVLMPWLHFGNGAVIDYEFPSSESTAPTNITFDNTIPGVSGIPWTLTIENCYSVLWGVNPYPGSDVTIRNSQLTMVMYRFMRDGRFDLQGIMKNDSYYVNETIPVQDRNFRLINTSVKWWKVDVVDNFQLNADSIVFSEMVVKDNSRTHLVNSICEGQTIHLGAKDNAFLYFENGEVWSYVSVWENAVMILLHSLVDWEKGKYIYQTSNIAHGNSRLYCLNSILKSKPKAHDGALVMFARIDGPDSGRVGEDISISGSAWIDSGPESKITFSRYQISWATRNGTDWTLIKESTNPVEDDILGIWDTSGLTEGEYRLRLEVWVDSDHSDYPTDEYPVYRDIRLY